jgi:plastocyanin
MDLRRVHGHAASMIDIPATARRASIGMLLLLSLAACAKADDSAGAASPTDNAMVSPTPTESPAATCDEPSRTMIELVAKNIHFSVKCLVVPAGKPLTVTFQNKDFANHNFSIYTLEFASEFTGDITYPNENVNYKVPALEPGQYLFQCDIHPADMSGPLIVQ